MTVLFFPLNPKPLNPKPYAVTVLFFPVLACPRHRPLGCQALEVSDGGRHRVAAYDCKYITC